MTDKMQTYIMAAIADGDLEPKEIDLLRRKAVEFGDDPDEVEMFAKAALAAWKKQNTPSGNQNVHPKSNKDGEVLKCPSCGAPVDAFALKCPECGHEFRNRSASRSVTEFFEQYRKADIEERAYIVQAFPVPNTREDIFAFLTMGIGNTKALGINERNSYGTPSFREMFTGGENAGRKSLRTREHEIKAWQAKVQQTIEMGRMLFTDNVSQSIFQKYEKQLRSNSKSGLKMLVIVVFISIAVLFAIPLGMFLFQSYNMEKETDRLNSIMAEVTIAIENKDWDMARLKAAQLSWDYSSSVSRSATDDAAKAWNQKRELLLQQIEAASAKK
jgi:DNA-directed RNA polymerase subunit M/transcription elongation factor TFIIS